MRRCINRGHDTSPPKLALSRYLFYRAPGDFGIGRHGSAICCVSARWVLLQLGLKPSAQQGAHLEQTILPGRLPVSTAIRRLVVGDLTHGYCVILRTFAAGAGAAAPRVMPSVPNSAVDNLHLLV
jgi:hypothetical protein